MRFWTNGRSPWKKRSANRAEKESIPVMGVKLSDFARFAMPHLDKDLTEFCRDVVIPATATKRCSMAEHWLTSPQTKSMVKSQADVFVSYAWKYKLRDLLDALTSASDASPDRFIWLDVLVINQHASSVLQGEDWMEKFSGAMKKIGKAELVLIPWHAPIAIKRMWCVYEHYLLVEQDVPHVARITPSDRTALAKQVYSDGVMRDTFQDFFDAMDIEKAEAFKSEDRDMILGLVKKVGAAKVNQASIKAILAWLRPTLHELAEASEGSESVYAYAACGLLASVLEESSTAFNWFKKCCDKSIEINGAIAMDTADAYIEIARALYHPDQHLESRGYAEKALEIYRQLTEPKAKRQAALTMCTLGQSHAWAGDLEKGLEFWLEATAELRTINASMNLDVAYALLGASICAFKLGRFNEALKLNEESLAMYTELSPNTTETRVCHQSLGFVYAELGRLDEALNIFLAALSDAERLYGENSMATTIPLEGIADLHRKLGNSQKAIVALDRALKTRIDNEGEKHSRVAEILFTKAQTYATMGNLDEARDFKRRACLLYHETLGPEAKATKKCEAFVI